jgi:hypothetical protein
LKVYKYRGGSNENFIRDVRALEENYFWSSKVQDLNDPWETIISARKMERQMEFLRRILIGPFKLQDWPFSIANSIVRAQKKLFSKFGIYSLSKTYKDEILWAHYSNSHKGFCIEYDLNTLISSLENSFIHFPVKYSKTAQEIDIMDFYKDNVDFIKKIKGFNANEWKVSKKKYIGETNILKSKEGWNYFYWTLNEENFLGDINIIKKIAGFKSIRWNYEKEYRILTELSGKHKYQEQAVTGIYFGFRMSDKEKTMIYNNLKDRSIQFFEIIQVGPSYRFHKKKYKPQTN